MGLSGLPVVIERDTARSMTTFRQLYFSFPIRLLLLHFRNHLILIGLWAILALFATANMGRFFGMHFLLLAPEYQGQVNFWSYAITGAAFGAFLMIWNLTTYLLVANRFAFLATLEAPFTKFSLNNSLIPLAFLGIYLSSTVLYQWRDELTDSWAIVRNVMGFLCGAIGLVAVTAGYLHFTNKDIGAFLRTGQFVPRPGGRLLAPGTRLPTLWEIQAGATRWRVDTYLNERLHLRLVRSVAHYDQEMLGRVFRQNHFNAVVVQVGIFFLIMVQGVFMDHAWVRIPTAASLFLLFGLVMALFGAITFWFRSWGTLVFLSILVVVNYLTGHGLLNYRNRAYGLDYAENTRAAYRPETLKAICSPEWVARDKAQTRAVLDRWLEKNRQAGQSRPKLVLVCVSGGGLRSAVWTMQTLQQADLATGGRLLRQTTLMSGASGGLLGAAYFREVYRRHQEGGTLSPHDPVLIDDISKDLLNSVSFAVVSNDIFFPLSTFKSGNFVYRKDRGYLFERQLNENLRQFLHMPIGFYRRAEEEARIPMMVLPPFIVNDARRLLISPLGVSYLMHPPDQPHTSLNPGIDGVDFRKMFAHQQPDSLAFTTALRMASTYPFILPNVMLPSYPAVESIDAGFRDNYGITVAVRFAQVFKEWIRENTGGVVVVQIRCWERAAPIVDSGRKGVFTGLLTPADVLNNITTLQDFEQDNDLSLLHEALGPGQLQVVRFIYHPVKKANEASLSLHLSTREKYDVLQAFYAPSNQENLALLREALQ